MTFIRIEIGGVLKGFHMDVSIFCGGYSELAVKQYINSNPLKDVKDLCNGKLKMEKYGITYESVFTMNDIYKKTSADVKKICEIATAAADAVKGYFND